MSELEQTTRYVLARKRMPSLDWLRAMTKADAPFGPFAVDTIYSAVMEAYAMHRLAEWQKEKESQTHAC